MCGLLACFSRNNVQTFARAREALASLKHRGPDESDYFERENIFLGHNRLSIVDIQHGQQPFVSPDGHIIAIVNGEIYNAPALRAALARLGYQCKSQVDGEVIPGLYQHYGPDFIKQLDGEFAFVLWDQKQQQMMAGRDRMGVKPLYYTDLGANLYFASEIKAFKALGLPMRWNTNYVKLNHYGIYHPEETCFDGINALAPGSYVCVNRHETKHCSYYEMSHEHFGLAGYSDSDYLVDFKTLFTSAVKKRLQADVPIACYLSGGIDSTSVLATANQLSDKPLDAFTIAFVDNPLFDEQQIAKASAAHLGSRLHCLPVTDQAIADNFGKMIWHGETLAINAHSVAMMLLSEQIHSQGYKVVLGGHGADELLGGYAFYQADIKKYLPGYSSLLGVGEQENFNPVGAGVVSAAMNNKVTIPRKFTGYETTLLDLYIDRQQHFRTLCQADQIDDQYQQLHGFFQRFTSASGNAVQRSTDLFTKATLQGYILSMVSDRMEMAHSLEGRVPFLDNALCDFTRRLPLHLKINQGREKFILREALANELPPAIYHRKKQPFAAPPANQAMYGLMESVFYSDLLRHSPFYRQEAVLSLMNAYSKQDENKRVVTDSILLNVLSTCLLQDAFNL